MVELTDVVPPSGGERYVREFRGRVYNMADVAVGIRRPHRHGATAWSTVVFVDNGKLYVSTGASRRMEANGIGSVVSLIKNRPLTNVIPTNAWAIVEVIERLLKEGRKVVIEIGDDGVCRYEDGSTVNSEKKTVFFVGVEVERNGEKTKLFFHRSVTQVELSSSGFYRAHEYEGVKLKPSEITRHRLIENQPAPRPGT